MKFFIGASIKIGAVLYAYLVVGEKLSIQVDEIVVRHAGDIVHHDLVAVGFFIRKASLVMSTIDVSYMVREDGRRGVFALQVTEKSLIDVFHHGLYYVIKAFCILV